MQNLRALEITLQSWNIYGKQNATVITMRFSMEAMTDNTVDIKYKKASHSQVRRDRERAGNYHVQHLDEKHVDRMPNFEQNRIKSPDQNKPINATILDSADTDQGACGEVLPTVEYDSLGEAKPMTIAARPKDSSDEGKASGEYVNNDDVNKHVLSQGDTCCDECGKYMGTRLWHRCTMCGDYNICNDCKNNGSHNQHQEHIQEFAKPPYPRAGFCHSCGLQFYPERTWFELYHCKECPGYALCFKCNRLNRHKGHRSHMDRLTLEQYYQIIH